MSSIGSIASGLLHAILPSSLLPNNTTAGNLPGIATSPVARSPDSGHISSLGQLAGALQQVLQSNPAQYQQLAQQIATNLQSAAQKAQASGNTSAATQLNQLSTDFRNASATSQLPNLQDLGKAVGGIGGYHHDLQGVQNGPLNAATIIESTLSAAGIGLWSLTKT